MSTGVITSTPWAVTGRTRESGTVKTIVIRVNVELQLDDHATTSASTPPTVKEATAQAIEPGLAGVGFRCLPRA